MSLVLAWLRLELRRRWRSLLVLVVLIALATGTVLTAVAGARRGAGSIDRLLEVTLPATAVVVPKQPGFDWAAVRALPQVEALSTVLVTYYSIEGIPDKDYATWFPPTDDESMRSLERPVVLDGRVTDPSRADEVVVTRAFVSSYGLGVGDTVTLRLYTPEGIDAARRSNGPRPPPDGPRVTATIVGVVCSSGWADTGPYTKGRLIPSPGLVARYPANLLGNSKLSYTEGRVRLRGGEADLPAFQAGLAQLTGRTDIDLPNLRNLDRDAQRLHNFESACLLAFGLASLLAALVLVGQPIARYVAATVADLRALRALGMTPRQAMPAVIAGPTIAAVLGTGIGVGAAVVASRWMPIGAAAQLEPKPGVDADWLVLGTGWAAFTIGVAGGVAAAGRLALAAGRSAASPRHSTVARAAARAGLAVPLVVGTRFALEPGQGRSAIPVRPALIGAVTGVLGVLAAFTFAAGVADAADTPARFGQTHQLVAYLPSNSQRGWPTEPALSAIAADPHVVGVNNALEALAESGDTSVRMFTQDPVGAPVPTVLTTGQLPGTAEEVALAVTSARLLGAEVGSTVELTGDTGPRRLTVTGIGFVPNIVEFDNVYDEGGWLTPAGFGALFTGFEFHTAQIALRPGVDPAAVIPWLSRAAGAAVGIESIRLAEPAPLLMVAPIRDVRVLPVLLGGFLALLAAGSVGHTLATAVRRRGHDLVVLRALGMTRWQSHEVVATQATVLAGIGLLFGVPLGQALGRAAWRVVTDNTPLHYVAPVAFWTLLLITPIALLAANLLAAIPGRRAARLRTGELLLVE